ncbi:MAG: periplasmic heavy metal sensor [Candidatus Latescibacterota bacterium]|nr:MAG: periplasmic heavy metal sensor [Candidatus Latescibacterota bacterium]
MKRGWFLVLAISIGLNAGLLAMTIAGARREATFLPRPFVSPRGPGGGPEAPLRVEPKAFAMHRLRRLAKTLDLTEDQRTRLAGIVTENMSRIGEEGERVQQARLALREECRKPTPDAAAVRQLVRRINDTQAKLDSLVAETMLREADVLTPDQRVRYFEAVPWEHGGPPGRGLHQRGRR